MCSIRNAGESAFTDLFLFLRCMVCHAPLPDTYYEDNDQPYCMEHFYEKSAHKCGKCSDYITGPTMVRTNAFVGDGRLFHFISIFL